MEHWCKKKQKSFIDVTSLQLACERTRRKKFCRHLDFSGSVRDWREKESSTEGVNDRQEEG